MRLQLIAWLVLGACASSTAEPRHTMTSRLHVYDDQRITVISPSVGDRVAVSDEVSVDAAYTLDAVSGATQSIAPDAVSSATNFEELRHQGNLSVSRTWDEGTVFAGGYSGSFEPDHWAHAVSARGTTEILDRLAMVSVGYVATLEGVSTVHDAGPAERSWTHQLDASWTHILSPTTVVSGQATVFGATCGDGIGCRANPYRYVLVDAGAAMVAVRERHPGDRFGAAGALRASHSLSEQIALHGGYRLFRDSWEVTGHTVDASAGADVGPDGLLVRFELRGTRQSGASFYASTYEGTPSVAPAHRTSDAELSRLWNATVGVRAEWAIEMLRVHARVGHMWMRYPDFRAIPERNAWLATMGIDVDI